MATGFAHGARLIGCAALVACAANEPPPTVVAHALGAGYVPENSFEALESALSLRVDGIELDVVVTADGVPVVSHDTVLSSPRCIGTNGLDLDDPVDIEATDWRTLQTSVLCGGAPDPAHPNAWLLDAELMPLTRVTNRLVNADPDLEVTLDLKGNPDTVDAVFDVWWNRDLPQRLTVTSHQVAALQNANTAAASEAKLVDVWLRWPPEASDRDGEGESVPLDAEAFLAALDDSDATGVALRADLATRPAVRGLRADGYQVALWPVNKRRVLKRVLKWPVDAVWTAYPADVDQDRSRRTAPHCGDDEM